MDEKKTRIASSVREIRALQPDKKCYRCQKDRFCALTSQEPLHQIQ